MSEDAPDLSLSKYRLGRRLGAGGMGEVYLARDLSLNRDVAIKFIAPARLGDPGARKRLIREAQAAAALDHPSICAVHEVVVDAGGRAYIVMQHVEGETLAERLKRGPLDVRAAIDLTAHVADALAEAHRHDVIHRDLKPQNIIMTASGRPKIVDFGIASMREAPGGTAEAAGETHTTLTGIGAIVGTPAYMSPEQVQGLPLDGRSDLFSLGAVLHECLTGRRAFAGNTTIEVCSRVLHQQPPPLSELRPELSGAHDELCRRLLAKEPADRFQSAEEVVGALRLLGRDRTPSPGDATRGSGARPARDRDLDRAAKSGGLQRVRQSPGLVAGTALLALAAAAGLWLWLARDALPPIGPEAERSYARGADFIRDGAYYSARLAFEETLRAAPGYVPAQARLAEALAALDEESDAREKLLRLPDVRLNRDERLRVDAIQAVVLHDMPSAVKAYRQLAGRNPQDARVWLDLGRVQEEGGLLADARKSYQQALALDGGYAAAHLRLASLDADEGLRDQALKGFDEAERLYHVSSNVEGETQTLLLRGGFLDGIGELAPAREALTRARALAADRNQYQTIKADIRLSSVVASEGRLAESERLADGAVKLALDNGLEALAADGLIELGATIMHDPKRAGEAAEQLTRAARLAERRGAERVAARARLNLASLYLASDKPQEALDLAQGMLGFLRERRLRRLELSALAFVAEVHESRGEYSEARDTAQQILTAAEEMRDGAKVAQALLILTNTTSALGLLPEALGYAERSEQIHRTQGDTSLLPFDIANRADLLIRLGRGGAADPLLTEIDAGIAAGRETYVGRTRRVHLLRALRASVNQQYPDAERHAAAVVKATGAGADSISELASALLIHARVRLGRKPAMSNPASTRVLPLTAREIAYWRALTRLAQPDPAAALADVRASLQPGRATPSAEFEWRVAAVGAAAARRSGDEADARAYRERAETALQRVRAAWKEHAGAYEARPDLLELRRSAGLTN